MKSDASRLALRKRSKRLAQRKIRPGAILIKYFRKIASADLNALYPNVRVVMSTFDKLFLGIPAVAGSVPLLFKIFGRRSRCCSW